MLLKKFKIKTLFIVLFILLVKTGRSQTAITEFGDFSPDVISLKQCDFDKDAEAVVLLDRAVSNYDDNYSLITQRRIRIKILKENGIERGNVHIRFYSEDKFEVIRNIEALVLNFDAQQKPVWDKLDRKSVYSKKLNKYYSELSFALPNIKVGSIFEYKYESQMNTYGGLREWTFQNDIPVLLSSYNLTILPNAQFAYSIYKSPFVPVVVKPNATDGSILFEMSNLPGLREEKYMGAANDYLQRVKFQFSGFNRVESDGFSNRVASTTNYSTTWAKLARELMENREFGTQLTKDLPGITAEQVLWQKIQDSYARMKGIHEYVKAHFNWNGIHSKFTDGGLKNAWEKKGGTNGEINLILINLLKAAGLDADPMLVSERGHGKVDTTYPYLDQFNKVVAYVAIDNRHYVLDGTDNLTPSFIIPFDLLNTTGFVVNKKKPALLPISDGKRKNTTLITVNGDVTKSGSMQLAAVVDDYDYAKAEKTGKYSQDKAVYKKEFFAPFTLSKIDSFAVSGATSDSLPLHHAASFDYALEKTGNYLLLTYNLFTGLDKNPFIADQRFSDIDFGCNYSCILNGTFRLPENIMPEALPKSLTLVMPDRSMSVTRQIQQQGNTIQIGIKVDFSKSLYQVEDYAELQEFYKRMLDILKEPILLKAKA